MHATDSSPSLTRQSSDSSAVSTRSLLPVLVGSISSMPTQQCQQLTMRKELAAQSLTDATATASSQSWPSANSAESAPPPLEPLMLRAHASVPEHALKRRRSVLPGARLSSAQESSSLSSSWVHSTYPSHSLPISSVSNTLDRDFHAGSIGAGLTLAISPTATNVAFFVWSLAEKWGVAFIEGKGNTIHMFLSATALGAIFGTIENIYWRTTLTNVSTR